MYFSEIYSIFFLESFFHILYLFEKWEFFMPHPVYTNESDVPTASVFRLEDLEM